MKGMSMYFNNLTKQHEQQVNENKILIEGLKDKIKSLEKENHNLKEYVNSKLDPVIGKK